MSDGNAPAAGRVGDGLLVLTMLYRPEPNFITADVVDRMAACGPVTVVTTHPNYPLGRFYPEVRRPWFPSRTVEGGVTVWRIPHVPDHSNSPARRLLAYLSFTLAALLLAPLVCRKPHTVWVYQTPFTLALAGLWFRWARGSRLVYTCADLWPESLSAAGVMEAGLPMRLLFVYSRWINRRADHIVCSTRSTRERYMRDGVPAERLSYVPVWVDGSPRRDAPPPPISEEKDHDGESRIVYAGNLGPAQALEGVVRAAAELERQGGAVRFDLYGTGSSEAELRRLAGELGAGNVRFHGPVRPPEAFAACAGATAQIVSLRPTPLFRMTVPSKLPFSFAAGSPILYGLEGEAAALAADSGGALGFDPTDPATLVAAVERLLALDPWERRQMRARLRAYFAEHFSPETLLEEYAALLSGEPAAHACSARVLRSGGDARRGALNARG